MAIEPNLKGGLVNRLCVRSKRLHVIYVRVRVIT